jgi:hypothetical protein
MLSGGISYFTFDGSAALALADHARQMNNLGQQPKERIKPVFLSAIYHELQGVNKYAFQLSQHGDRFRQFLSHLPPPIVVGSDSDDDYSVDEAAPAVQFAQSMSVPSSQFQVCNSYCVIFLLYVKLYFPPQVAGITNENNNTNLSIKYRLDGKNSSTIPGTSHLIEPLCYPLLFPFGERGWGRDIRKDIG